MTPEEHGANILRRCWAGQDKLVAGGEEGFHGLDKEITAAVRDAVAEEREANIAVVREYLQFDSQRAVSWHEVEDAIAAIRKRAK